MSHDIQAAWVTSEIAQKINNNPSELFADVRAETLMAYASRESRTEWPITDGVISIEEMGQEPYGIAVEFKRPNEGLHGILTALGQAHAYLKKGYKGSLIVIPDKYESHLSPGGYLSSVINYTSFNVPIGIITYTTPDPTLTSPFKDKLQVLRKIDFSSSKLDPNTSNKIQARTETQWAHLREGSSDSDAFYKYLLSAKQYNSSQPSSTQETIISKNFIEVIDSISPGVDPYKYLSNSSGDLAHDIIWRKFWFTYILTNDTIQIWKKHEKGEEYVANETSTRIELPDGGRKYFFVGRSDSIKNKLVKNLNENSLPEYEALRLYVENVRDRAHSYREDIDSGLEHLGLLESDGRPSNLGYKFCDICERQNNANASLPRLVLGAILLKNGQLGAFLHYVYKLSESRFSEDPMAFTVLENTKPIFNQQEYLTWLESELANNLRVMRKVSARGGVTRKPFQAELAILRNFGYVSGFRIGVGLEVNWPAIQEALDYQI